MGPLNVEEITMFASELVHEPLLQVHTISFSLFFYYASCHQNHLCDNFIKDDHTTIGDALSRLQVKIAYVARINAGIVD